MTKTPLNIDRIVREVLAELNGATTNLRSVPGLSGSAENTVGQANRGAPAPAAKISLPTTSENGDLVLSTRLVTLAEIGSRLVGVRRVVVGAQTVVTPAVRDALRQRNIELCHAPGSTQTTGAALRLVVVGAHTKTDPKLLANALQSEGINVVCHSTDCLLEATDHLAGELAKGNTLGLLLTPHTAAALCLANRLAGVRAVLASDTNSLDADTKAVGANLLVVDPQRVGFYKLSAMAGEFCRGGIRPCPEIFKKRLM
jgi:hypothetical protein